MSKYEKLWKYIVKENKDDKKLNRPELEETILKELDTIDISKYLDATGPLIRKDIEELKKL